MIDLKKQSHAQGGAFLGPHLSLGQQIALYFTGHTCWISRE
jgi:hypothetical protein